MRFMNPFKQQRSNKSAKDYSSKSQQKKVIDQLQHPVQRVVCKKCNNSSVTLYKVGEDYFCKEHKDSAVEL